MKNPFLFLFRARDKPTDVSAKSPYYCTVDEFHLVGVSLEHDHRARVGTHMLVEVVRERREGILASQLLPELEVRLGDVFGRAEPVDCALMDDECGIEQDEACNLNCTANKAAKAGITLALSNSLGFGGHNACLAFRKV